MLRGWREEFGGSSSSFWISSGRTESKTSVNWRSAILSRAFWKAEASFQAGVNELWSSGRSAILSRPCLFLKCSSTYSIPRSIETRHGQGKIPKSFCLGEGNEDDSKGAASRKSLFCIDLSAERWTLTKTLQVDKSKVKKEFNCVSKRILRPDLFPCSNSTKATVALVLKAVKNCVPTPKV